MVMKIRIDNTVVEFGPSEKLSMIISSSTYRGKLTMIPIKDCYEQKK